MGHFKPEIFLAGHEKIIEKMLETCDAVVINLIGPKPGDVNSQKLKYIYENILKLRFNNRINFIPIRANMFYAGPGSCTSLLYERMVWIYQIFNRRDHAGSDNFYDPSAAKQALIQNQDNFIIKILTHNGAYFCKKCEKILLQGSCLHNKDSFTEISGSKFRNYLKNGKIYKFASADVINWAMKNLKILF